MKILVTAVGGDIGQSAIKCLRDSDFNPHISGCDKNPYAAGRADVDRFILAPPVIEAEGYLEFLRRTIEDEDIDYVFPLSDIEIVFFNRHRELFKESRATFIVNPPYLIDTFMDKYRTVQFFQANDIAFPKTWLPEQYDNQLGFPLVLKKRVGRGGRGFAIASDSGELAFYLRKDDDLIIQEYLPGEGNEYTAGIFSDGRNKHCITFQRVLSSGGFSQQVELVEADKITELPRKIAEALEFIGSLNVQFKVTESGPIPFEINPRFSSTVYFRHLFGFKDVKWSLDLLEGKSVDYHRPIGKGVGVRKSSEVVFFS
jgi:carbamoyl-phosphate synthase large subunit